MSRRQRRRRDPASVAEVREVARRRLPRTVFDFVDGGAEDEVTLRENRRAFDDVAFRPRVLVDVGSRPQQVEVLGQRLDLPVVLGPAGLARLVHPDGETAAAVAAERAGTVSVLSSGSSVPFEDVAGSVARPQWFQLYPWGDRSAISARISRASDCGFRALVVTVDVPVVGARERDLRNGLTVPPTVDVRTAWDALRHPAWLGGLLRGPAVTFADGARPTPGRRSGRGLTAATTGLLNPGHTWSDLEWMVDRWRGPVLLKGVMSAADARRAVDVGCGGIVVSNHGGRQCDSLPAGLDVLEEVVAAVAGRAEVLLDGGIRRGSDVVKALALGARAVLIGRPWMYGLGAQGTHGVEQVLTILRDEIDRTLALIGRPGVATLDSSAVASRSTRGWHDRPGPLADQRQRRQYVDDVSARS